MDTKKDTSDIRGRRKSSTTYVQDAAGQIIVPDVTADGRAQPAWRVFLAYAGPGLLISIAYLDTGNLEADMQQGAQTGLGMLWVPFVALFLGFIVQRLAARLGNVTGMHLAQVCSAELPGSTCALLYCSAELAIIAADVQQVLGSAVALNLLLGLPLWVGCLMSFIGAISLLATEYFGVRVLEAIILCMVGVISICFFIFFYQDPPSSAAFAGGLSPTISNGGSVIVMATIGASIQPHNIYLHSALVLSRSMDRSNRDRVEEANWFCALDAGASLFFALLVNVAVICTFAQVLYSPVCAALPSPLACLTPQPGVAGGATACSNSHGAGVCGPIGLRDAGPEIVGTIGGHTKIIWGLGLLAAGQSSTMMGTYAGQFLMDGFLRLDVAVWARGIAARLAALVPAVLVASMQSTSHFFDVVNQWLNVMQMLALPYALIPLLKFTSSSRCMGVHKNSEVVSFICWLLAGILTLVNCYAVIDALGLATNLEAVTDSPLGTKVAVYLCAMMYFASLSWVAIVEKTGVPWGPDLQPWRASIGVPAATAQTYGGAA